MYICIYLVLENVINVLCGRDFNLLRRGYNVHIWSSDVLRSKGASNFLEISKELFGSFLLWANISLVFIEKTELCSFGVEKSARKMDSGRGGMSASYFAVVFAFLCLFLFNNWANWVGTLINRRDFPRIVNCVNHLCFVLVLSRIALLISNKYIIYVILSMLILNITS